MYGSLKRYSYWDKSQVNAYYVSDVAVVNKSWRVNRTQLWRCTGVHEKVAPAWCATDDSYRGGDRAKGLAIGSATDTQFGAEIGAGPVCGTACPAN